jgi:hypothetical protein
LEGRRYGAVSPRLFSFAQKKFAPVDAIDHTIVRHFAADKRGDCGEDIHLVHDLVADP